MLVAIYTRLSPNPKKDDTKNQERELLEFCAKNNWQVYKIFKEIHVSGSVAGDDRKQFSRMMEEASQKKFDVLLVWALDRLSREGTYETMTYLRQLTAYGIGFRSYREPGLDTTNELVRNILITAMSDLAKQERVRISDRTKAGLETAIEKGRILGRPTADRKTKKRPNPVSRDELLALSAAGLSYKQMTTKLKSEGRKIGQGTIWRMMNSSKQ